MSLNIEINKPESAQESSFQNATLQTAANGIACSIAIHPKFPADNMSQSEIKAFLEEEFAPLVSKGWTIEAQIGPDCESETLSTNSEDLITSIQVGDIVEPANESVVLRSGAWQYADAVVVSINPFVLVSRNGDMRWSNTVKIEDFKATGRASDSLFTFCRLRITE